MSLFSYTDDPSSSSREGRLEICINHAWGSVCGGSYFDDDDASVACGKISGFSEEGLS